MWREIRGMHQKFWPRGRWWCMSVSTVSGVRSGRFHGRAASWRLPYFVMLPAHADALLRTSLPSLLPARRGLLLAKASGPATRRAGAGPRPGSRYGTGADARRRHDRLAVTVLTISRIFDINHLPRGRTGHLAAPHHRYGGAHAPVTKASRRRIEQPSSS